jgi:regulator of sirC expression with transglutaminase-like and TPR domain
MPPDCWDCPDGVYGLIMSAKIDIFMNRIEAVREQFACLMEGPEDNIDLVDAALLIARTAYPDLIGSHSTDRLNQWAERLRSRLGPFSSAGEILTSLNQILFDEEGFRGDIDNYFDPQNSYLNRVLDRRLGIPLTLSLVYSEVGRRAGFPIHGIALPGHFITGLFHASGTLYIDPFNRGEVLAEKECHERIALRYGQTAAMDPGWKTPADKKTILKRMLRNLKGIYRQLGQERSFFEMLQWILVVDPNAPDELKERGLIYEAMGNNAFAVRDMERYVTLSPTSEDSALMLQTLDRLRNEQRRLH